MILKASNIISRATIKCNLAATTDQQTISFACELLQMVPELFPALERGFATAMVEGCRRALVCVRTFEMAYQLSFSPTTLLLTCNSAAKFWHLSMFVVQVIAGKNLVSN
jgi:hypothetical protein